jgi:AraC family transcriptional regulator of adaptative response / DNA-3-methyladenine glycosylase II
MELNPEICYLAILSHDRRFDGRFFTGIATTGIYCRPICPVRPAKRENMRFYACAAAAEEAGFRPCRRCRPELSPGTPDWIGSSEILSRSLRLIAAGALDDGNVKDLAREMGVSERQLRRIFIDQLGAPPGSIARKRRVDFSMQLLEQTDLPVIQVAFAAGFGSVREFNHAFRTTFGLPPREVRQGGRRPRQPTRAGSLTLRLPYRPPFDWEGTLRFIASRITCGCESVSEGVYSRSIRTDESIGTMVVHDDQSLHALVLEVTLDSYESLHDIVHRTRNLFDLRADPEAVNTRLAQDPDLAPLVSANPGLRLAGVWDGFEFLVRAIVGETLTACPSQRVLRQLVQQYGEPLSPGGGGLTHLFPKPSVLAQATSAQLENLGLSQAKASRLQAFARAAGAGAISWDRPNENVTRVMSGLADAGAEYVSMRLFREPDAFPSTDAGLLRCMRVGSIRGVALAEARSDRWRPWRAYGALHILRRPKVGALTP